MVNEDPPLIDRITIIVSIVILGLLILSIFICVLREDKKNEDESQFYDTQLAQWESPRIHHQVLGSLMGDNLLNEYMSMPEDQRGTIRCESTWRHLNKDGTVLRGKAGEWGVCQFMWDTFELFKRQSKKTDLSIYSADDQIELMTWAFEQGDDYKKHWTCWRDLYENN